MDLQSEREKQFFEWFDREKCIHRKTITIQIYGLPPGVSSKPCCTHPNGPKVTGILGIPDPDPWFCDAAIEEKKCPLGNIDIKSEGEHD